MSLNKNVRRSARKLILDSYRQTAKIDSIIELDDSQLVDLRVISSGFRIVTRSAVDRGGVDHAAESLLSRTQSAAASKLVAACAYYLCCELLNSYERSGDPAPAGLTSFMRRCDLMTGERHQARSLILVMAINHEFSQVRADVTEAVAQALGSCVVLRRAELSSADDAEMRCKALVGALYATSQQGLRDVIPRLSRLLAEDAVSDGYRLIAEYFRLRVDRSGASGGYLQALQSVAEAASRLDHADPARELACNIVKRTTDGLTDEIDAKSPEGERNLSAGVREMAAENFEQAIPFLDHAAGQIDDPVRRAVAAIFSFNCSRRLYCTSKVASCGEFEAVLHKLTAHGFAAARNYHDCSDHLRLSLDYCVMRAMDGDHDYAWLSARVADLLGEYTAGAAIGGKIGLDWASDIAARELAITDLLTGAVALPSVDLLRALSRSQTIMWVNQLITDNEAYIVTSVLGPHDKYPQFSIVAIRSSRAQQVLSDAVAARLDDSGEEISMLRSWIFQRKIDPDYPVVVVADRQLWSLPWPAIVPEPVVAVTVMPSAAALTRLSQQRPREVPVIAGVFDLRLRGARAELAVLEALRQEGKIILRRADSLAELVQIIADEDIDLLTIATHGTTGDGFEYRLMFPTAAASPAGLLGMRLPPRVVLGCCWSARFGERADSIATAVACMSAGASSVVGALWDVNDWAAGAILERTYRDFAAGSSLSSAIRVAYLSLPEIQKVSGAALTALGIP